MNTDNKKIDYINFLRSIAVIIITHAHTNGVWPVDIHGGKALGNALFFIISGFLIKKDEGHFLKWYSKKLIKIYIPLFIVQIIWVFIDITQVDTLVEILGIIKYWFIPGIAIDYIIVYIIINYCNRMQYKKILGLSIIIYIALYLYNFASSKNFDVFDVDNSFALRTLLGLIEMQIGLIFNAQIICLDKIKFPFIKSIIFFLIYGVSLVGSKFSIGIFYYVQFVQHISAVFFAAYLFIWARQRSNKISGMMKNKVIGNIVEYISSHSLEIYLVQMITIPMLRDIIFPLNLFVILVSIFFGSLVLKILDKNIIKRLIKLVGN